MSKTTSLTLTDALKFLIQATHFHPLWKRLAPFENVDFFLLLLKLTINITDDENNRKYDTEYPREIIHDVVVAAAVDMETKLASSTRDSLTFCLLSPELLSSTNTLTHLLG